MEGKKKAFADPMRGAELLYTNQTPSELDTGMDLRDYFAAKVIQGIMASPIEHSGEFDFVKNNVEYAYRVADAMIEERLKPTEG